MTVNISSLNLGAGMCNEEGRKRKRNKENAYSSYTVFVLASCDFAQRKKREGEVMVRRKGEKVGK